MTALGKLWFRSSGSLRGFFINNEDADVWHIATMSRYNDSPRTDFNDLVFYNGLAFYNGLLKENGCIDVKISSIRLRYGSHGMNIYLQAIYRLTFEDGTSEIRNGPQNCSSSETTFYLNEKEYITGIHVNHDPCQIHGITFITNQRREHFGQPFGDFDPIEMMTPATPVASMRIVAICDSCTKIGFYAQVLRWYYHGPYILMRQLVNDGRAHIQQEVEGCDKEEGDVLLPSIIQALIHSDEGVFRNVMKFLA